MSAVTSQKTINKETVQRLLKDVKQIIKNPLTDNGIYYIHDETDMMKGYAMIVGPQGTPYFGGYYFFQIDFPYDYPYSPPKVTYCTNDGVTRYNPNLYKSGKVCLSILNTWSGDKWSSCQTITSLLNTLCSLLNEYPLENEPGHSRRSVDFLPYQKSIEFCNINYVICDFLNPSLKKMPDIFKKFYPDMITQFIKNYETLLNIVENKKDVKETQIVSIYSMKTVIDYEILQVKLTNLYSIIQEEEKRKG